MLSNSNEILLFPSFIVSTFISVIFFLNYFIKVIKNQLIASFYKYYKYYICHFLFVFILKFQDKNNLLNQVSNNFSINMFSRFLFISPITSILFCPLVCYLECKTSHAMLICYFTILFAITQILLSFQSQICLFFSEVFRGISVSFSQVVFEYLWISSQYHKNNFNFSSLFIHCQIILLNNLCASIMNLIFPKIIFYGGDYYNIIIYLTTILSLTLVFPLYYLLRSIEKNEETKNNKIQFKKSASLSKIYKIFVVPSINFKAIVIFMFICFHNIYSDHIVLRFPELISLSSFYSIENFLSYDFILWSYLVAFLNGINIITIIYKSNSTSLQINILILSTLIIEALLFILNSNYCLDSFLLFYFVLMFVGLLDGTLRPICLMFTMQNFPNEMLFSAMMISKLVSVVFSFFIGWVSYSDSISYNIYISILLYIAMNILAICLKLIDVN